jgi:hypothetical protein
MNTSKLGCDKNSELEQGDMMRLAALRLCGYPGLPTSLPENCIMFQPDYTSFHDFF